MYRDYVPARATKNKNAPAPLEARQLAIADALRREDRERIAEEAKEAAAAALADFERKRGYR
jgi:hypothetical protein